MKKIISLALCCVIAASTFASCAQTPAKNYSPKITVSSSEADTYASWLTNRLGDSLENSVYLALGNDSGIDLSNFENDGYVIRTDGASAVIAGKTASGLDMAVRKYANEVDAGRADALDIAYHEGNRIDELRLAGTNIAEYAIEYPAEHNENMLYAISQFQMLIKKATGVELSSSEGITKRAHAIEFRHSDDAALRDDGYRYFFEGSRLVIEGAVARGCMYGAWFFLEKELGWRSLTYGNSYLPEAKLIDLSADTEEETVPMFDLLDPYLLGYDVRNFATDAKNTANKVQRSYGPSIVYASHGSQDHHWGGYDTTYQQICYTDEDVFENVKESVENYIAAKLAAGSVIGLDFKFIDIAQGDNAGYCRCTGCLNVSKEEGGARSGAVVRFANRLENEVSETYDGLMYLIYAYMGTQPPCKTAPNEHVSVTFAMNGTCANHALDTKDCSEKSDLYAVTDLPIINNDVWATWVREWCALSDNIVIWYYSLANHVQAYTMLDIIYDDVMFFGECGVRGLLIQEETHGLGMHHTLAELVYKMNWYPDMTEEEFDKAFDEVLEEDYGEGWAYVREYIDGIWNKSQDIAGHCWNCWGYMTLEARDRYYSDFLAEKFDTSVWLLDKAVSLALNARQQRNAELLTVHMIYEGCVSSYFKEYDEGDTARIAVLDERYNRMIKVLDTYGPSTGDLNWSHMSIRRTLEESAWLDWAGWRDELPKGETQRPAPEKYADAE